MNLKRADLPAFWAAVGALLVSLVLTATRSDPPAVRPTDTADRFSAVRAAEVLESLYADRVTHPTGTAHNAVYKKHILAHLRELGYEPSVHRAFVCHDAGSCGHVENIQARLAGSGQGKAVLLAVHYDSVGAGPSVSDDGVAVAAALEIARLLKAEPRPVNDIIFLIDDGEEVALLGAVAFAAEHPWANDVGAVVNLEARGTGGRSYMFETGSDNAWLVELMRRSVPRPASSSLFYSIYQRLPNDTDFTIFKKYGMNGVNFAFIRDVVHYHTPLDDLDHYSLDTMQHQGDNALAMVRALAATDLESPPTGTASWFDVWNFGIVSWPEAWNLPLAIFAVLLVTLATGIALIRGRLPAAELVWGQMLFPIAVFGSIVLAAGAGWFLTRLGKLPAWPTTEWAPKAVFWLIGLATPALVVILLRRRTSESAAWLGALEWLGLLAIVTSVLLPGAAYLFLAPALVGGLSVVGMAFTTATWWRPAAVFLTLLTAGAVQLVLAWSLWEAMGITVMPLVTFFVASLFTLALISCSRIAETGSVKMPLLGLILAALLAALAPLLPAYCSESPRPLNLYFVQDADRGTARWCVQPGRRPLPDAIANAVAWRSTPEHIYPWHDGPPLFRAAEADPLAGPGPRLEITESLPTQSGRILVARLLSPRGADTAALVVHDPTRVVMLSIEGWEVDLDSEEMQRFQDEKRRVVSSATIPAEGLEIRMEIRGSEPLALSVLDYDYGLPPTAQILLEARPDDVVPLGRGDQTVLHAQIEL